MLRKVVYSTGLAALVPIVAAATPLKDEPSGPPKPPVMRSSELPIYDSPHADYAEYHLTKDKNTKPSVIQETLYTPVKAVRESVQTVCEHTESVKNTVQDHYHDLQDRTDWIVKYLREEENKDVRYGAVVMGGLTGFIFGLRGGFFRRVLYAGLGTTGMGMVCFPEETKNILKDNGTFAKQYINIAYNFLYGVKPGDPQLEVKFPELSIPKTLSEFVDLAVSVGSSVKQAVMPPPSKESTDSKPSDKKE